MSVSDNPDLERRIAVMEEKNKTLEASIASTLEGFRKDMESFRKDMAIRDKENTRWQVTLWVATVVILGIIVRWPVSQPALSVIHQPGFP